MDLMLSILRVLMGLLMLAAGLEKLFAKRWSAKEFLANANWVFADWYHSLAGKRWVDVLNMWGLTMAGAALILGAFVKIAGLASAVMMLLYYFAYKPKSPYLVFKETLIYAFLFVILASSGAGFYFGLDTFLYRWVPFWLIR